MKHWLQSLVGTPYLLGSRDIKRGVDCYTLLELFAAKNGVILPKIEYKDDWYKDGSNRYLNGFKERLNIINDNEFKTGDLILFRCSRRAANHAGIYFDDKKFIHATKTAGVVISRLDEHWKKRLVIAGRLKMESEI